MRYAKRRMAAGDRLKLPMRTTAVVSELVFPDVKKSSYDTAISFFLPVMRGVAMPVFSG